MATAYKHTPPAGCKDETWIPKEKGPLLIFRSITSHNRSAWLGNWKAMAIITQVCLNPSPRWQSFRANEILNKGVYQASRRKRVLISSSDALVHYCKFNLRLAHLLISMHLEVEGKEMNTINGIRVSEQSNVLHLHKFRRDGIWNYMNK